MLRHNVFLIISCLTTSALPKYIFIQNNNTKKSRLADNIPAAPDSSHNVYTACQKDFLLTPRSWHQTPLRYLNVHSRIPC